jgi:hypothetical protein
VNALRVVLLDNLRGLLVLGGALLCYGGVAALSWPIANIVGGILVMAVGAYPYLLRLRKS